MKTDKKGETKIRVLIVHALIESRELIKNALSECNDIQVVGTAPSGSICLIKTRDSNPDIILLDVGITDPTPSLLTKQILTIVPAAGIILITSAYPEQKVINETITSLQNGAFDFIERPHNLTEKQESVVLRRRLLPKIRTFSIRRYSRIARIASGKMDGIEQVKIPHNNLTSSFTVQHKETSFKLIVIGVSTGGPDALSKILPLLPSTFPVPIIIVLHMPEFFTKSMAYELDKKSSLTVKEAEEGEFIQKGNVYLARGGKHLVLIKADTHRFLLHIDNGPEVNGCKPSVDVFFNSVADAIRNEVIGIILSGMGEDGVKGISRLKVNGAKTIAQDAETSIVWGMPGGAVKAGVIDEVLPLQDIAVRLMELTGLSPRSV